MRCADPGPDFDSWRGIARSLLDEGVPPGEVLWEASPGLFSAARVSEEPARYGSSRVPAAFVELAKTVACHCDPGRWALLYRILWRIVRQGERHLLEVASDEDMAKARSWEKNVRREIHKMHAFVRFKLIDTDETTGRERYAAWLEPDHFIVEAGAPFFRKRFANMDWSIFTPKGCVHWIGGELSFSPGMAANPVEDPDALEVAWRTYYRHIFNPARLKVKAMQSEMPKRYWKNLPEADLIADLIGSSRSRVDGMLAEDLRPAQLSPRNTYLNRLQELSASKPCSGPPTENAPLASLAKAAETCRACPLWEHATQTVFGEGPEGARIMIVGEQPGDREDVAGRPFVGPAGKLLDQALAEAGIDRSKVYLTNAVKHFKWTPRGKTRLHQKPNAAEIDACKPWVMTELKRISPDVLILLGATAARSLLGRSVAVTKSRGLIRADELAKRVILTVHPSYLLRLRDSDERQGEFQKFVDELASGL